VCALHSKMSALDYTVEPWVECPDDDAAFVLVTATIGGRDTVQEFVARKMYPLASSFGFSGVSIGMAPMSKIQMSLPLFLVHTLSMENGPHVLEELDMEDGMILGSFGPKEFDALEMVKLPNAGHLNHVFEQMGVAYAPCLLPGTEAFQATREK
jgi:hypothetical protein